MGGAGTGTSQRSEVTSIVALHCLSLLASLASPPEKVEWGKEERERCVEEKGGESGSGTQNQPTHDACRETRESVGVGEKMEVTATIP